MQGITRQLTGAFIAFLSLTASLAAEDAPASTTVVISVAEQKLAVLRDGELLKKYPVSTSKFGVGDGHGSYRTPLGKLRVCDKIGEDMAVGAVFKSRHATGEILPANSPGRDPIVTRIIWLEGLEAQNENARGRGIYIHGTNEEKKIGQPVSYGCIRMRSKDVLELFDELPLDASVSIIEAKLPKYSKYTPHKPQIIAAAPAKAPAPAPAVAASTTPTRKLAAAPKPEPAPSLALAQPANATDPMAKHALKGSILMAGLPEGPKMPSLPAPSEPKDVPRFSPWVSASPSTNAISLQDSVRDLEPAIQAVEAQAAARREAAEAGTTPEPSGRIAFRSGQSRKTHQTP